LLQVFKAGWLDKRGKLNRAWKRRWFVLKDSQLEYYKTPDGGEPQGVILLADGSSKLLQETKFGRNMMIELSSVEGRLAAWPFCGLLITALVPCGWPILQGKRCLRAVAEATHPSGCCQPYSPQAANSSCRAIRPRTCGRGRLHCTRAMRARA